MSNDDERLPRCPETGKVCFIKKVAETKKNLLEKMGVVKELRLYHCPFCNWTHLTKEVNKRRK